MANSLHFVRDKEPVLARVAGWLRPGGRLLVVEYDSDRGNTWVPHPMSYRTWEALAARTGFLETRLLRTIPSRFLGRIYSALSLSSKPAG
jgi:ubiquinone/menaquinone biosynthesis C-methylase UbiE